MKRTNRNWLVLGGVLTALCAGLLVLSMNLIRTKITEEGGLVGGVLLLGLLTGLWVLISALRFKANPESHPLSKQLAKHGPFDMMRAQFDNDLGSNRAPYIVSPHWVVSSGMFGSKAWNLKDVAWVYQTTQRVNGIPIYKLTLHDKAGKMMELPLAAFRKEGTAVVQKYMETLAGHAPWVKIGYSDALKKQWGKDRKGFIADVDARRAQVGVQA